MPNYDDYGFTLEKHSRFGHVLRSAANSAIAWRGADILDAYAQMKSSGTSFATFEYFDRAAPYEEAAPLINKNGVQYSVVEGSLRYYAGDIELQGV